MSDLSITVSSDITAFANQLKLMIYNGKKLSDPEALALAQYARGTDLNPFVGECYYLPGIGPGPGIAGWRKKADEQLEYEARRAAEPLARFWCDYVDVATNEIPNLEVGDLAVKAVLHDTLTKNAWEKRVLSYYIELVKNKVGDWDAARALAGDEPTWSAVGVVRKGENFGGDKMPRYERACKRAEKAAIRKRFPRLRLSEPAGFDDAVVDAEYTTSPALAPRNVQDGRKSDAIIAELYAETPTSPPEPEPTATDTQPEPTRPYPPAVLKAKLAEWSANYAGGMCGQTHRQKLAAYLNAALGDESVRHDFDRWAFGHDSLDDVSDAAVLAALKTWMGITGWGDAPDPLAVAEAQTALIEIQRTAAGQPETETEGEL